MKKIFFLTVLFATILVCSVFAQQIEIKSLQTYTSDNLFSIPVLEDGNKLIIEFDVQSRHYPNFAVLFRFCDKNWKSTDNIFLLNQGYNIGYNLDHISLPVTVKEDDASFHFRTEFPDKDGYVKFPFSGKWKYYIVDSQDHSKVFAEDKFIVLNKIPVELNVNLKREEMDDKTYYPIDFGNVYWVSTSFNLTENLFPSFVDRMEIIQNRKVHQPYIVDKSSSNRMRYFEWDANTNFTFVARDVFPGNEYRQVDLRNVNKFISRNVNAKFEGFETERFFKSGYRDLDGGFFLNEPRDPNSTYHNVTFSIKPASKIYGDVYLTGAFNEWQLLPDYQMTKNDELYTITKTLKRGVYDYQYVVAYESNNGLINADWIKLEGNNWSTSNEFTILLFYNDTEFGGYDRLIGYKRITIN